MAIIVCTECGKEFSDKATACPNCGCPTSESKGTAVAVQVAEPIAVAQGSGVDKQAAIEHLSYANSLEQAIYTCKEAMWKIEEQMNKLGHKKKIAEPNEPIFNFASVGIIFLFCVGALPLGVVLTVLARFLEYKMDFHLYGNYDIVCLVIGCIISIMASVIYLGRRILKHKKALQKYRCEMSNENARVEKELKQRDILHAQWNLLDHDLTAHKKLLKKLYSVDVLFPKYRNMVAVATILEYFESGICDKFTGADGAYSRYENDVKLGTIIDRLDAVVANLQQIRKAQYLLYQAIEESNAIAEEISYQAACVAKANGTIAENTKLIAYNTERAAFNTSVSAYVDAFN